jgi:hypothetical protein
MTMTPLFKYYRLDWLAMCLSLLAVYLLGNKNEYGFVSFVIANAIWVYLGLAMMQSYGIAVGNLIFGIMNTRGFFKWSANEATK